MFTSVQALHIGIDEKLNYLNSNRKLTFLPDEKDLFLNEQTLAFIKQRTSKKSNAKKEGFEDSIKRYDDLQELKRSKSVKLYKYNSDFFAFNIPNDYLSITSIYANINYNKNEAIPLYSNVIYYIDTIDLSKISDFTQSFNITKYDGTICDLSKIFSLCSSKNSLFYFIYTIIDYVKDTFNLDVYYEYYNNVYYPQSLIFVTNVENNKIVNCNKITIENLQITNLELAGTVNQCIDKGLKGFDLISNETYKNMLDDYYLSNNLHLNCPFIISNNTILTPIIKYYKPLNVTINYIKKPKLISYKLNQMCELTSAIDEILNMTVTTMDTSIPSNTTIDINKLKQLLID